LLRPNSSFESHIKRVGLHLNTIIVGSFSNK